MPKIRRPETVRLELTGGHWLIVKKHLTAGEERRIYTRMIRTMVAGERANIDPEQAGLSLMVEYLLDWSVVDPDGKPVIVRDQSPTTIAAALNALDSEGFAEVRDAIEKHAEAMQAERDAEKNDLAGATSSSAT